MNKQLTRQFFTISNHFANVETAAQGSVFARINTNQDSGVTIGCTAIYCNTVSKVISYNFSV